MYANIKTPSYVISEEKIERNVGAFASALSRIWPNSRIAYSVKTNALPGLLRRLRQLGLSAEVVSDEEYALAQACGFSGREIVFNGPIKGCDCFCEAVLNGSIVNIDSKRELGYVGLCQPGEGALGLRVNIPPSVLPLGSAPYCDAGFRFGFAVENGEFKAAKDALLATAPGGKIGLHLHCNTTTRSVESYRAIANYAARLIKDAGLDVSFVDMGGGFWGGVEGKPTPYQYIEAIYEELRESVDVDATTLIIEPGSAIIASAVDLVTTVIDAKETTKGTIVTTDGGRTYLDPLWNKTRYEYSVIKSGDAQARERTPGDQIICGYTCMDHDRIMTISHCEKLHPGDRIVYHRVGAYTVTFGGAFIRSFPEVYFSRNGDLTKTRRRMTVEEFMALHCQEEAAMR